MAPPTDAVYGPSTSTFTAARPSLFLHNPGYDDELGHRERKLAALLCTPCGSSGDY